MQVRFFGSDGEVISDHGAFAGGVDKYALPPDEFYLDPDDCRCWSYEPDFLTNGRPENTFADSRFWCNAGQNVELGLQWCGTPPASGEYGSNRAQAVVDRLVQWGAQSQTEPVGSLVARPSRCRRIPVRTELTS